MLAPVNPERSRRAPASTARRQPSPELVAAVGIGAGAPWRPRGGTLRLAALELEGAFGTDAAARALALAGARHEACHGRRPAVSWLLVLARRLLEGGEL